VNPLPDRRPGQQRAAVRTDARLDAATRQNVDDLATRVDRPRAAVLCQIMAWGLSRAQPAHLDQGESPGPVHHLYFYVASELYEHVQQAAAAAGVKTAPWLRHMVRQVTIQDFPASWQVATPRERSHDSRTYTTRFMLRLDESSQTKLQQLITQFGASKADIIRQLIAQAKPEDFPPSWQMRATERRAPQARS
jgi:predicted transcriptional regulator